MSYNAYPFGPPVNSNGQQVFPNDLIIEENNPGLVLEPTEPNGVYFEMREVAGCTWLAVNATYSQTDARWEQNSPANAANPAYALEICAQGLLRWYYGAATITPGTAITWVVTWQVDQVGNQQMISGPNTLTSQAPLAIANTWNGGSSTIMHGKVFNLTDTSSAAASFVDEISVNSTPVWRVRKDGTLITGIIPFANVTGFFVPSGETINNPTFTGTSTFDGPVEMEDGASVTGGLSTDTLNVSSTSVFGGLANFEKGIQVEHGASITGGETVDSLIVTGTEMVSTLNVTGNETVGGSLGVTGTTTLGGNVILNGTLSGTSAPLFNFTSSMTLGGSTTFPTTAQLANASILVPVALQTSAHTFYIAYHIDLYAQSAGTFTLTDTSGVVQAAWDNVPARSSSFTVAAATHTLIQIEFYLPGNLLGSPVLELTLPCGSAQIITTSPTVYNSNYENCIVIVSQRT